LAAEFFGFTQAGLFGWFNVLIIVAALAVLYGILKSAMDG